MTKSVSFDVLGTCFHFQPLIDLIAKILSRHPTSIDATTLFHLWFYAAQRDFTYTSIVGGYTPIAQIFKHTFRRACLIVGFTGTITDEDISAIMSQLQALPPRPGLKDCYDGLRDVGFDVYAVTNGGEAASLKYYELAGVALDSEHLLSCDELRVAKPDPKVYENAVEWVQGRGCSGERWFVAAHSWDLIAARKAGYKTAWVAHEEVDAVTEVFGEFDVYAKDLVECMEKIKAA